jgi:hypothetical protein
LIVSGLVTSWQAAHISERSNRVVSSIHDIYEKTGRSGTMTFMVVRYVLTNQRDELVATIDNRMMYR